MSLGQNHRSGDCKGKQQEGLRHGRKIQVPCTVRSCHCGRRKSRLSDERANLGQTGGGVSSRPDLDRVTASFSQGLFLHKRSEL
jgi:hypothetical protein